jgi:hypothetical protein
MQLNFNKQKLFAALRRACDHLESEPTSYVQDHTTATYTRSTTYRPVISDKFIGPLLQQIVKKQSHEEKSR